VHVHAGCEASSASVLNGSSSIPIAAMFAILARFLAGSAAFAGLRELSERLTAAILAAGNH